VKDRRAKREGPHAFQHRRLHAVWFEPFEGIVEAIQREKALKKHPRQWKINLIERQNPDREDLYPSLL
jgi:putative endonuclease